MLISNYYRGGTDKVTGFVADTDRKVFKCYSFRGEEWIDSHITPGGVVYEIKEGFRDAGDLGYNFPTKVDMEIKLHDYQHLGFKEDADIVLDFGIFTK